MAESVSSLNQRQYERVIEFTRQSFDLILAVLSVKA